MRWQVVILLILLAGCAGGRILPPLAAHDRNASFLTAAANTSILLQPIYNHGRDDVWTVRSAGVWVTAGDFQVTDCCSALDGNGPMKRIHVAPGRHYLLTSDKNGDITFVDAGAAPQG